MMLWIVIGVLFLVALYLVFQAGSRGASVSTGSSLASGTESIDTTGWTENEIMNYEMHGTIPAQARTTSTPTGNSGGMVGGC